MLYHAVSAGQSVPHATAPTASPVEEDGTKESLPPHRSVSALALPSTTTPPHPHLHSAHAQPSRSLHSHCGVRWCSVQKVYCRGFLYLCGVEVKWEGLDAVDYCQPVVGMFSHGSNMDPMILASGPFAYKWIAKHSLFRIPLFGWTLAGWGHYPINRSNVESAKRSLAEAATSIHRYQRCLAVSPEGTRSKSGRLMDFKKGPFHTAIAVQLPIVPVLIMGAYQLWPPNQLFPVGGDVVVRMLPAIEREEGEGYRELSGRVRRAMLRGIAEPVHEAKVYTNNSALYVLWIPLTLTLCWMTVQLCLGRGVGW